MKQSADSTRTLAVLGNLTLDEIISNRHVTIAPGGSALYVSATSSLLGTKVDVISRVGSDYPRENLTWLGNKGVQTSGVKRLSGKTCRFRLHYRHGFRTLRILQNGSKLRPREVHGRWGAIHIGPVFREVPASLVPICRQRSQFLSMDLQGFVRQRERGGKIVLKPAKLRNPLRHVNLLKATVDEILIQTASSDLVSAIQRIFEAGPKYLLVTLGRNGSILAEEGGKWERIPAYPEKTVADPTGAGDTLMGGFLATYLATKDPLWAACVGAGLASLMVREKGLGKFHWSKRELFRRAAWVYDRASPIRNR